MSSMECEIIDDVFVVIHNANPPSSSEWSAYLAKWKGRDMSKMKTIVITDGGGPNSAQRKAANEALEGKASPTAVITPSTMVRGIVTALNWFNPKIKAFSPSEAQEAYQYLGIEGRERQDKVTAAVAKLRSRLTQQPAGSR